MVRILSFGQKWARSLNKRELKQVLTSKLPKRASRRLKQIQAKEKRLVRNEIIRRRRR